MTERTPQSVVPSPMQLIGLLLILAVSWLLWSGIYKPLLFGLGLFSCVLSAWLAQRMGFFSHAMPIRSLLRLPAYWWWVLREVAHSSVQVARLILSPSMPISPTTVTLRIDEPSDAGKVILGNAITLSPGTVTIDVDGNMLLVHCLTRAGAEDLLQRQEVQRRTAKLGVR